MGGIFRHELELSQRKEAQLNPSLDLVNLLFKADESYFFAYPTTADYMVADSDYGLDHPKCI